MGSKRSSKNPNNTNPTVDTNHQNPKTSTPLTPSKSHKKQKLSTPIPNNISNDISNDISNEIPNETSPQSPLPSSRPTSLRWAEADTLKLLKSILSLRAKNGIFLKSTNIPILLKEIKDWIPVQLSEKNLDSKLRHLRTKFHKSPKPGPETSDFDRNFHELASKLWGPKSPGAKTEKVSKKKVAEEEKEEEEEREAEKNMVLENGEEHDKDENSYRYLRFALEEYWKESKLNIDTLHAALPKVNHVQAKRLDEKFREVFLGMLKLKMDKNKVSNEIIHAFLGC